MSLTRSFSSALKDIIPALLVLGSLSLGLAPQAQAQLTFSVDSFTTDELIFTINPGSLDTSNGASANRNALYLVDADSAPSTGWVVGSPFTRDLTAESFGSSAFQVAAAFPSNTGAGDFVQIEWVSDLSLAGDLTTGVTVSFSASSFFDPSGVTNWSLVWGSPNSTNTVQSTGPSMTGGTSTVPEPNTYASVIGMFAIGWTAMRRRGRR